MLRNLLLDIYNEKKNGTDLYWQIISKSVERL